MASLHRYPHKSRFWYAAFRTASGKRVIKSTKLTDRKKALEVALNLERCEEEAASGHLTATRVRELLSDTLERINGRALPQTTVRVWFTKWLDEKEGDGSLSGNSVIAYRAAVRLFLQHLGKRADEDLAQVSTDDIQAFKQARIVQGLSAKTVDRDLKVIRAVLKQARLHGHIDNDPAQLVALLTKRNKRNVQTVVREAFGVEELEAITASATGEWLTTIMLARYTGARLGDCVRMRWKNVDLPEKIIRYSDAKTHKDYVVPLHPRLDKYLRSLVNLNPNEGALCPALSVKASGGKYGLSMEFRRIMAKAEIDDHCVNTKAYQLESSCSRLILRLRCRGSALELRGSDANKVLQVPDLSVLYAGRCRTHAMGKIGVWPGCQTPPTCIGARSLLMIWW